ncbi:MAG: hypothetical protein EBT79_10855 [Actinobacteria bacterium]|nr:hypothetical protein [Actinomycetota bacterium]
MLVLACRAGFHNHSENQYLCVSKGTAKRFQIFTANEVELRESLSDVAPVEFDDVADVPLNVFMIESFWRLQVDLDTLGRCIERGLRTSPSSSTDKIPDPV